MNFFTYKFKVVEEFIHGVPKVLIRDGKLNEEETRRVRISDSEIQQAIRSQGCKHIEEVELAVMEPNGDMSVIPRKSSGAEKPI